MRPASAEVIPYALPFEEPYVTARGVLRRREMVLLRLRDEYGVVGLGEAVPLSLRGGATPEQVARYPWLRGVVFSEHSGDCNPRCWSGMTTDDIVREIERATEASKTCEHDPLVPPYNLLCGDDEDLEDLKTVRDAVDYVFGRLGGS